MFSLRRCNRSSANAALCSLGLIIDWSLKPLVIKYTSSCSGPVSKSGAGGSGNHYMFLCDSRVCARTTSLQGNYLVKTLGPVTACSPLIKDSSHVWVLSYYTYDNKQAAKELNINRSRGVQGLQFTTVLSNMESYHIKSAFPILSWNGTQFITMRIKKSMELAIEGDALFPESFPAPSCSLTHKLARVGRYRIRFNSSVKVMLLAKKILEEKSWQQSNMDN